MLYCCYKPWGFMKCLFQHYWYVKQGPKAYKLTYRSGRDSSGRECIFYYFIYFHVKIFKIFSYVIPNRTRKVSKMSLIITDFTEHMLFLQIWMAFDSDLDQARASFSIQNMCSKSTLKTNLHRFKLLWQYF